MYNHSAKTLKEATGVSVLSVLKKAESIVEYSLSNYSALSQVVEAFEKTMSKKELAVLAITIMVSRKTNNIFENRGMYL